MSTPNLHQLYSRNNRYTRRHNTNRTLTLSHCLNHRLPNPSHNLTHKLTPNPPLLRITMQSLDNSKYSRTL